MSQLKPLAAALAVAMVKGIKGRYAPIDGQVPSNFVIDGAGILRYAKPGALDLDALNATGTPLLREPTPAP